MRFSRRIAPLSILILALPFAASAQAAPTSFKALAGLIVQFLNVATILLIAGAIAVYFYGILRTVLSGKEGSGEDNRKLLFWGIGIIFVMVSIWGILQILENTLFGGTPSGLNVGAASL